MTNFNQRVNGSTTREEWLGHAAQLLRPHIEERTGRTVNAYRIGVGDLGIRTLGLCWAKSLTQDSVSEITITLRHSVEPAKMLGTLVHEMIHAAGVRGHRRDFAEGRPAVWIDGKAHRNGIQRRLARLLPSHHRGVGTLSKSEPTGRREFRRPEAAEGPHDQGRV